jgi:hypothetical protein
MRARVALHAADEAVQKVVALDGSDGPLQLRPRVQPRHELGGVLEPEQRVVALAQPRGPLTLARCFGRLRRRRGIVRRRRRQLRLTRDVLGAQALVVAVSKPAGDVHGNSLLIVVAGSAGVPVLTTREQDPSLASTSGYAPTRIAPTIMPRSPSDMQRTLATRGDGRPLRLARKRL